MLRAELSAQTMTEPLPTVPDEPPPSASHASSPLPTIQHPRPSQPGWVGWVVVVFFPLSVLKSAEFAAVSAAGSADCSTSRLLCCEQSAAGTWFFSPQLRLGDHRVRVTVLGAVLQDCLFADLQAVRCTAPSAPTSGGSRRTCCPTCSGFAPIGHAECEQSPQMCPQCPGAPADIAPPGCPSGPRRTRPC